MATVKGMLFQHLRNRFVDLLLPIVVGFICGLEAIIIKTIVPLAFDQILAVAGINEQFTAFIMIAFLIVGAYITALLTDRMQETSGVGLDVAIKSYHFNAGIMPKRFAPLKFLATFFSLGSGGSGGLVGPTASIGQGTASYFSKSFKLPQDKSRMLALCGLAGCVSGLLHTPFGSTVFALELCYLGGIIYEDLIPVLSSSISAYIMSAHISQMFPFGYLLQQPHLFRTITSESAFPWNLNYLEFCVLVALATTFLGVAFIRTFQALQDFCKKKINIKYSPIIGALLVGLISVLFFKNWLPDVLSQPSDQVEHCASVGYPLHTAIILLIGRWINTFLTAGFGGSGGLFAPIILLGGLSGNIIGELLGIANTKILVTTGMSAALSGVINVPMAAIIIVVEIFGVDYILPAAIGSSIAFILARNWVIYPHIKHIKTP